MSRHTTTIAVATFTILALVSLAARAETVSRTLDGKALALDVSCVDQVEIQPQVGLAGKVMVEASANKDGELGDFVFTGGTTASVVRDHHACAGQPDQRPKISLSIQVPTGMPVDIKTSGSTDVTIGAVGGVLRAAFAGSGNFRSEKVTDLTLSIAGSTDARIREVGGLADIRIAGGGNVEIGSAEAPSLTINVRGSGSVAVGQGKIGTLSASVAGSGNLDIEAVVQDASLSTAGSGNIDVAKVTGKLSTSKAGSGSISRGEELSQFPRGRRIGNSLYPCGRHRAKQTRTSASPDGNPPE